METQLLLDWISTTSHGKLRNGFRYAFPSLNLESQWSDSKGLLGYDHVQKHNRTGVLMLKSTTRKDMGCHIIYSGKSLSKIFDIYAVDAKSVLEYHIRNGANISRLDIAIDVFDSGLSISHLKDLCVNKNGVVTTARTFPYIEEITSGSKTLYIGSITKRKKLVRIYDKAKESGVDGDWIRIEFEIHGKPATSAALKLVYAKNLNDIAGMIKGYVHFPSYDRWTQLFTDNTFNVGTSTNSKGDTRSWLLDVVAKVLAKESIYDDSLLADFNTRYNEELNKASKKQV